MPPNTLSALIGTGMGTRALGLEYRNTLGANRGATLDTMQTSLVQAGVQGAKKNSVYRAKDGVVNTTAEGYRVRSIDSTMPRDLRLLALLCELAPECCACCLL